MINNELLTFIKERTAQGSTKEQITDMLVTHGGWDSADVEEAFDTMDISSRSMKSAMSMAEHTPPTVIERKMEADETKPTTVNEKKIITPNLAQSEVVKSAKENTPVFVVSATPTTPNMPTGEIKKVEPFIASKAEPGIKKEPLPSTVVSANAVFPPANFQKSAFESTVRPITNSQAPKTISPVYESPGFSLATNPTAKTLQPTQSPDFASARLGTFDPKSTTITETGISDPFHQMQAPAIPEIHKEKEVKSLGAFSLGNLRNKFSSEKNNATTNISSMQAKVENSATPRISTFSPFPSSGQKASEKISEFSASAMSRTEMPVTSNPEMPVIKPASPFGSSSSELSPHLQSGMTPTPGVFAGASPSFGLKKPVEPSKGVSAFSANQKLPSAIPMPIQHSLIKRNAPPKGRKLLGTIMFLMGFIFGAVGMHAYLNEYLNPAIDWVQNNIPALSQNNQ